MAPNELDVRSVRTLGGPDEHPTIFAAYAGPETVYRRRRELVPEPGVSPAQQAI